MDLLGPHVAPKHVKIYNASYTRYVTRFRFSVVLLYRLSYIFPLPYFVLYACQVPLYKKSESCVLQQYRSGFLRRATACIVKL
jgi:hypothetical protein